MKSVWIVLTVLRNLSKIWIHPIVIFNLMQKSFEPTDGRTNWQGPISWCVNNLKRLVQKVGVVIIPFTSAGNIYPYSLF